MDDLCKIFSQNFKNKRKELGLTQKEIAESINYSTKAISKLEAAHALPPTALLPTLAKIMQTSVDELLAPPPVIKYYLGIAGYDERCDLALYDINGNALKNLTVDILNPTVIGLNQMLKKLTDAIFKIAGELSFGEISVSVGIDGIFRLGKKELDDLLRGFGFALVKVLSNSRNLIEVALGSEDGVFVNLGYNAIVFAKFEKSPFIRIGGYGYNFDEPFSAFSIGKEAIKAVFLAQDGIGKETMLDKSIRTEMNIFEGKLSPVLFSDRILISRLSKTVFSAYRLGDNISEAILQKNAEDLATMIFAAASKFDRKKLKLVICGSLCSHKDVILPILRNALKSSDYQFEISVCDIPAVKGALMLAGLKQLQ